MLSFVSAKGSARRESAGLISYLAQQASALHPESQQPPVISMEYDIGYVEVHPLGCIWSVETWAPSILYFKSATFSVLAETGSYLVVLNSTVVTDCKIIQDIMLPTEFIYQ